MNHQSATRFRMPRSWFATIVAVVACAIIDAATIAPAAAAPKPAPGRCIEVQYEGGLDLAGHYERPGVTRHYHSRQRFLADGKGAARLEWTTWSEGDSAGAPEVFLVVGERVFQREDPTQAWRELAGERAELGRLQGLAGLPWLLPPNLEVETDGDRIVAVSRLRAHPRLGDVRDSMRYTHASGDVPDSLTMTLYERDHHWRLVAKRIGYRTDAPAESLLAVPSAFDPAPPADVVTEPTISKVADGVWSIDQEDVDSRSLVVEFADHLAVIEAAVGSANGERLVDVIQRRWPSKPIRWALFSHHHPHYTGGLRALIAVGATVITTPGNEAYVRSVAAYRFGLAPDRLARAPRPLEVRTFETRLELADATNRLILVDLGTRSTHTDEFVIFWLPGPKLVFETEQGWLTTDGTLRAGRRAKGFLQALADEKIDAERFVQSWPMRGNRAAVSRAELEALVAARERAH